MSFVSILFVWTASVGVLRLGECDTNVESIYATIFATEQRVELPRIVDLLQELSQSAEYENVGQIGGVAKETMDRIVGASEISASKCDLEELRTRMKLRQEFDDRFVNLGPYLKFVNSIQFHMCLEKYDSRWMKEYLETPNDRLTALYELTAGPEGIIAGAERFVKGELRDPKRQLELKDRMELKRDAANIAYYIKFHAQSVESKFFESPEAHEKELLSIYSDLVDTICVRLFEPTAIAQEPYHSVTRFMRGDPEASGWTRLERLCRGGSANRLEAERANEIYPAFMELLDKLNVADKEPRRSSDIQKVLPHEKSNRFNRMVGYSTLDLLRRLEELEDDPRVLREFGVAPLIELSSIKEDKCTEQQLRTRLDMGAHFDCQHATVFPYVRILNEQQFDLCYLAIRRKVAHAMQQISIRQLSQLEFIRTHLARKGRFMSNNDFRIVALLDGLADLLSFRAETFKTKQKLAKELKTTINAMCAGVIPLLKPLIDEYATLNQVLRRKPNYLVDTARLLVYGQVCVNALNINDGDIDSLWTTYLTIRAQRRPEVAKPSFWKRAFKF